MSKQFHAKYTRPYLLRDYPLTGRIRVGGFDFTYIRMGKGFMYLFNIIDWYSRKVIDYELSSTLEKDFVLRYLRRAFRRCKPEILYSGQGPTQNLKRMLSTHETYLRKNDLPDVAGVAEYLKAGTDDTLHTC